MIAGRDLDRLIEIRSWQEWRRLTGIELARLSEVDPEEILTREEAGRLAEHLTRPRGQG